MADEGERRDSELAQALSGVRQPHSLVLRADLVDLRHPRRLLEPVANLIGEVFEFTVCVFVSRVETKLRLQVTQIANPEARPHVRMVFAGASRLVLPLSGCLLEVVLR